MLWALCNILVGYILFRMGHVSSGNIRSLVIFFVGAVAISLFSSVNFQKKEKE